ncbi:MAG: hypothetical protein PVG78_09355 [Desulfobacterales bacterium]|jgi:uncharacterized protein (DUF3084 family)
MIAHNIPTRPAAVLAAVFLLLVSAPATAGSMEELKKGFEDLKTSIRKAPGEMKADGEKTWEGIRKDAGKAAKKSKEAVKEAPEDAEKGWEEVTDAVKSQE